MADPAIVRARWDPDEAFVGRVMVLQLRLWRLLYVHARVRVTRVWDEERVVDGRRARVFGFEYETLPGHLEIGRMDYEVLKFLRRRRGPVPVACPLARVRRRRVVGADRVPAVRPARAGAVLLPVLCADRAADRVVAGAARSDPAAGGAAADAAAAELTSDRAEHRAGPRTRSASSRRSHARDRADWRAGIRAAPSRRPEPRGGHTAPPADHATAGSPDAAHSRACPRSARSRSRAVRGARRADAGRTGAAHRRPRSSRRQPLRRGHRVGGQSLDALHARLAAPAPAIATRCRVASAASCSSGSDRTALRTTTDGSVRRAASSMLSTGVSGPR